MTTPTNNPTDERLGLPSASALEIAVNCPGMPGLRKSLPPEAFERTEATDKDEWAERGTRIHTAFETGDTKELDAEESETYRIGVQFEEAIVQNWMRDKSLPDCAEGPRETRYFLNNPSTLEPIGSAKPDRHYVSPPHLLVIDLKTGWNPNLPPSPRSWQLRLQAVALWQEYADRKITDIRVGYCKPKSHYGSDDVCDYTETDLSFSLQSIIFHLWETTQPHAPRHAGHWCNWCPCKAWCPEAGAYSMLPSVIARRVPDSGLMPWEQMVQTMAGADLHRIWESSTIIGKILDAVKDRLKKMPAEELAALGLQLGTPRKLDNIGDIPNAYRFLTEKFSEPDVLACMSFGKGALVELIRKKQNLTKEAAGQWFDTQLNSWIVRETSERPLKRLKG